MNKEMLLKTIEQAQEDTQKFLNINSEKQRFQEQLLKQVELNLKQLKDEEDLIRYYCNKIDIIDNYLGLSHTDEEVEK